MLHSRFPGSVSAMEVAMTTCNVLSGWDEAVSAYLTNRRALGRGYRREETILNDVRAFLVKEGRVDLDRVLFDRWRESFYELSPNSRIVYERAVYNFCLYRRRREPECFLPDPDFFARRGPSPLPTLIEPEQIKQLLTHLAGVRPMRHDRLRPMILRMAIILLYTTGLRRGELTRLTLADVDADRGVLFIRNSKFHKSRWVPVSAGVRTELRAYLEQRRHMGIDSRDSAPLLYTWRGHAYTGAGLYASLRNVLTAAGIRGSGGRRPRVQDFRHSFAVAALRRWYENDVDVQVNLPKLALYMGHVSIVSTAHYLRWMPAVIAHASQRFERAYAGVLQGGAS
jgi:integrase/recombinase XerD